SVSSDLVGSYRDFDIVLAMGVLHHLDDGEADDLLRMAASALRPGGRFIALDGVLTENQGAIERAIVLRDRGRFVRSADGYERLARARFDDVESRIYHGQLRIPYAHLAMSCRTSGG